MYKKYKNWITLTESGLHFPVEMLCFHKESDNFEDIKKRIYKCLLKDNRYSNYDKEEIEKLILSTEKNEDDYYIWDVGGKEYRVGFILET
ncbi:hypothetical protein [Flavobacterium covae]